MLGVAIVQMGTGHSGADDLNASAARDGPGGWTRGERCWRSRQNPRGSLLCTIAQKPTWLVPLGSLYIPLLVFPKGLLLTTVNRPSSLTRQTLSTRSVQEAVGAGNTESKGCTFQTDLTTWWGSTLGSPHGKAGVAQRRLWQTNSLIHVAFSGSQVVLLVYSFLRKAAWDYGRLGLLIHNDR